MSRFAPTRAGIINLWDYRDEEFLFVDGWLVLRGPNGSGKTKALEVLFPYILDGRIEPRRLNPFAGEDRTMKSNVLYRGQELSHAYVWMEFSDGTSFVTIGIGLRAHRHNDRVTRWHFVADGRVGADLSLLDADDRPVSRRDLIDRLSAEAVVDSAEEYRHLVDARLFGLGPARYEQLLDLVLTLRRPQLAKDLNPAELSRTLQRGLRPVEEHLLTDAARSFEDMEAVARTLEGLVAADAATSAFLTVYATYLRTHSRAAADAVTARRDLADERREALAEARQAAARAATGADEAEQRLRAVEGEPARLRAHRERLKGSAAYRSHEQLADLERHVHDLAGTAARSRASAAAARDTAGRRRTEWQQAVSAAQDSRARAARTAAELSGEAEAAGIAWTAADADPDGLEIRLTARAEARRDDMRVVRDLRDRLAEATREHTGAAERDRAARDAAEQARIVEEEAAIELEKAKTRTAEEVRRWGARHERLLDRLATPGLAEDLSEAVDSPSLRDLYAERVAPALAAVRDELAAAATRHERLTAERAETVRLRDSIAAEHDDAPPPVVTRPAPRQDRAGAPLWRLVRFADEVPGDRAAAIEAALHASGLLDAWVHPSTGDTEAALAAGEQDAYLRAATPAAGDTLATVLLPEEQQQLVPAARITSVLTGIALGDLAGASGVAASGGWAQGSGVGSFTKQRCEYIGATARAARRAERIAECDRHLAELDCALAEVTADRDAHQEVLAAATRAAADLPGRDAIRQAERGLDRAAAEARVRREAAREAASRLDAAVAEQAHADMVLRRAVAERSLPVGELDAVAAALSRFDRLGIELRHAYDTSARAASLADDAAERHTEAGDRHRDAEQEALDVARRHAEKDEELTTLSAAIGAEAAQVLAEVAQTEKDVTAAEATLAAARDDFTTATEERAATRARVQLGEQAVDDALAEARHEAVRLRPYAQADLLGLIRAPGDLRWPVTTADGDDLDPAVVELHEAILAATRELNPTETSLKQSATRLTSALTDLQAQLPAAGQDHRPEWDTDEGVIVVRVADDQGLSPVAQFAGRIATERRDQEQLLTDAEQRVFEDALLGQLAGQIHRRTVEARDLVAAMDTQMRARRMSSGLTVGVGWRLSDDLDAEQREVCKLLERDPARLGPAQLTTLRRHFAGRIRSARAQAPEKPYRDLLAEVLDYRQWRVFAFTLHRPGGVTEALTRARHSQLSGGEQSVSLHLPLFAAANALFGSARPDAPRLLGLDEAFAGVDDNGRGELMALAKRFDLDLFMTGYDLWATYPAVTGAAHYDLSHSSVDHTVSAVLLVWDGTASIADFDGSLAHALGAPSSRAAAHG
ncbi:TIGR02680 family protein [Mangrovihabitans endophyticus]|uniref:TIGR02680 family protein n=1 Tax=Mangrovihabitans endophyticus TaxID=1751298 RepID=A0A8J3BUN4_9ACTN|nr:TIGR02680 family protein [Mangrovihabitans endophyticus]GGK79600.1 hypothetical protein GCM10012284_11990 [Mangrovihabitans endophyticus]